MNEITTFDSDDVKLDERESGDLALVFTAEGSCVLEEDGEAVWMSDDDDDFAVEFGENLFLEADRDCADVLNYLVDEGWLDEEEKSEVEVETEVDGDELSESK